ncbi:MAG: hypothetical protein K2I40_05115, partial [Bifidobacterium castoris]|nr:hypothetical protein [Bifidobacterium castoris]
LPLSRPVRAYWRAMGDMPERLGELQRLQGLEGSCLDYRDVELPDDAVVYVDPPYLDTRCTAYGGFDFNAFHSWLDSTPVLTVVSEYTCPPHCVPVAQRECLTTMAAQSNRTRRTEGLFVPERQFGEYEERMGLMG